jgi:hypothetical protein
MNCVQAGYSRITDEDMEITTAAEVCQQQSNKFYFFY